MPHWTINGVTNGEVDHYWMNIVEDNRILYQESWMNEPDLEYWEHRKVDLPKEVEKADNLTAEEKEYIIGCMLRFFDMRIKECIDRALDIR